MMLDQEDGTELEISFDDLLFVEESEKPATRSGKPGKHLGEIDYRILLAEPRPYPKHRSCPKHRMDS